MDLFGMGPLEILLILVIAFLLLGPNKVPEVARSLGKAVRMMKKAAFDLTAEVTKEVEGVEEELKREEPGGRQGAAGPGQT